MNPTNRPFPLVITSLEPGEELPVWLNAHRDEFNKELTCHGAILFRGFGIRTAADFDRFTKCFDTAPLPYMFRSSPRQELDASLKNIYLSTSYPSDRSINMHNESSYSRVWGRKIVFCCLQPAETGGETPIADSRRILEGLSPSLVERFRQRGVRYRRNLMPDLGMPWQEVFQTTDRTEVGEVCKKNAIDHRFVTDDHLVIEWTKRAVYRHPLSDEETWFNHILFFNKYARYEELDMSPDEDLPDEYLTSNTFYGDGSPISYAEYAEIKDAYRANTVAIRYEQGDVLFLDNMLAAHGRNPYTGKRVIATAIMEAEFD